MHNDLLTQGFNTPTAQLLARSMPAPTAPKTSLPSKVVNFGRNLVAQGLLKPAINIGADVSNTLGNAETNIAHGLGLAKNVHTQTNQQQFGNAFGDLVQEDNLKNFAGNVAQVAPMVVAPGLKGLQAGAPLLSRIAGNAAVGGIMGAGSGLAQDNTSVGNVAKQGVIGAGIGGALAGVGGILGRVAGHSAVPQVVTHDGATTLHPPAAPAAPAAAPALDQASFIAKQPASVIPNKGQPLYVDYYENARNAGKKDAMEAIAKQHPDDARVQIAAGTGSTMTPEVRAEMLKAVQSGQAISLDEAKARAAGAAPPPTAAPADNGDIFGKTQEANRYMSSLVKKYQPQMNGTKSIKEMLTTSEKNKMDALNNAAGTSAQPADYAKTALSPSAPPDLSSSTTQPQAPSAPGRGNLLQRVGRALQKPAMGATAPASPFGAAKIAEIEDGLKSMGLVPARSNAETIYNALPAQFTKLQGQVKGLLAADKNTVNPDGLAARVEQAIGDNNHFLGSDAASESVKQNVQSAIQKLAATKPNGVLTTSDLYNLKGQLQDELTRAYDKVEKGATLTGGEDALLAARDAINDFMPKDIKAIGHQQSLLFDASVGLNKARLEKARLPTALTLGLPKKSSAGLSHGIQSVGTGIGVPIEAIGTGAENVGKSVAPAISAVASSPAVNAFATPAAVQGVMAQQNQPASPDQQPVDNSQAAAPPAPNDLTPGAPLQLNPQTGQLEEVQQAQPDTQATSDASGMGITSQMVEQAMIQDLAQNGGANLGKLNTIYSILAQQEKAAATAAKQPKIPQAAANAEQDAQTAIQGLQDIQAAFNKTTGTGKGLVSKIAGRTPLLGNNVAAVNNAIRVALPSIAKSLGYGTTTADLKALLAQLPSTSDTQKSAAIKLSAFQTKIQETLQQNLAIQEAYQQQAPDTTDQSASLSPDLAGATI